MTYMRMVAVLCARRDSVYKNFADCDVYDFERDARTYSGVWPIVAHPPCRAWGRLRKFARPVEGERELAIFCVEQIRRCGGVLEHPAYSTLWVAAGLPKPNQFDDFGGFTLSIDQNWFGHRAKKPTWLYICGLKPRELPKIPIILGEATHVIETRKKLGRRPSVTKAEREHTPPAMAHWLKELALACFDARNRQLT